MKIRNRVIFNNLLIGLLPLLIISVLFLLIRKDEYHRYYLHNMDTSLNNFKLFLEEDLEKYRYHALFIAQENPQLPGQSRVQVDRDAVFALRTRLRIIEVFEQDRKTLLETARWRDYLYTVSPPEAEQLWGYLSSPDIVRRFTLSIPRLVSNILVFRNCAPLLYRDSTRKAGFVSVSLPLDLTYFRDMAFQEVGVVFFIQTPGGIQFSDPAFQQEKTVTQVLDALTLQQEIPRLDLGDKGHYFLHYSPYITVPGLGSPSQPEPQTYIGVLYEEDKLNRPFHSFRRVYQVSVLLSLLVLAATAWWFSASLTRPIRSLQDQVREFEVSLRKVPPPDQDRDEITELQGSISRMSERIVANQAIIARERDALRHKQEIQLNELEMARNIQNRQLPLDSPHPALNFYFQPMEEVSGDYYDFIPLGPDRVGIMLSDVSGHGIPAAFITAMLKSFTLQNQEAALNPAEFMISLNRFLLNHIGENFVTALYGIMDFGTKKFTYCNAGHLEPLVLEDTRIFSPYHRDKSPCLGVFDGTAIAGMGLSFTEHVLELAPSSHLLLYTDGLTETVRYQSQVLPDQPREEFGDSRFMQVLFEFQEFHEKNLVTLLAERLQMFRQYYEFDDDICIITCEIV